MKMYVRLLGGGLAVLGMAALILTFAVNLSAHAATITPLKPAHVDKPAIRQQTLRRAATCTGTETSDLRIKDISGNWQCYTGTGSLTPDGSKVAEICSGSDATDLQMTDGNPVTLENNECAVPDTSTLAPAVAGNPHHPTGWFSFLKNIVVTGARIITAVAG